MIKYDGKRYLSKFVSGMIDSLQLESSKGAAQYDLKSLVTMATYWAPDIPNINSISGQLQRSIFIFANGTSYV